MRPEQLDERTLLQRTVVLSALSWRLELFAEQRNRPSAELKARVHRILERYGDLGAKTPLKPGTALSRYFDARLQVVRASMRARLLD